MATLTPEGPPAAGSTELKVQTVTESEWRQRAETAEAELAKLRTENAYLKKENEALMAKYVQVTRTMNEELESARKRIEDAHRVAVPRAQADRATDEALCQRFGLPAGDFAVASYSCRDRDSKPGTMILTPTHVCFEVCERASFMRSQLFSPSFWPLHFHHITAIRFLSLIPFPYRHLLLLAFSLEPIRLLFR